MNPQNQNPQTNPNLSNPFMAPTSPTAPPQANPYLNQNPTPINPQPQTAPSTPPAPTPVLTPNTPLTNPAPSKDSASSTQSTLLISELRDGLAIMKDGSFRAVVACKSINFDLMSSSEREGVEYSYQSFLNSLDFSIQILLAAESLEKY